MAEKPFRFLDLPAELRCMVYERLNVQTRLYTIKDYDNMAKSWVSGSPPKWTVIIESFPNSILASRRSAHTEAASILADKLKELREMRETQPIRFIVDAVSFNAMFDCTQNSVIKAIERQKREIPRDELGTQWVPTCLKLGNRILTSDDAMYRPALEFINRCARNFQKPHSKKILIAVRAGPNDSTEDFPEALLAPYMWGSVFQVERLVLGIYEPATDYKFEGWPRTWVHRAHIAHWYDGMAHMKSMGLRREDWEELWEMGEVVELN